MNRHEKGPEAIVFGLAMAAGGLMVLVAWVLG